MIKEKWVRIKGFEKRYKISNFGRIKSIPRTITAGVAPRKVTETVLKLEKHYRGYHTIKFRLIGGGSKRFFVHRLVAEHFIPNPENKDVVNHIDCDKRNNHITNLEWFTFSENTQYYYACKKKNESRNDQVEEEVFDEGEFVKDLVSAF